jgi:hypothetical protein
LIIALSTVKNGVPINELKLWAFVIYLSEMPINIFQPHPNGGFRLCPVLGTAKGSLKNNFRTLKGSQLFASKAQHMSVL